RIAYVNPAARRFLGADGMSIGDPLPDGWRELSLRELGASLLAGEPPPASRIVEASGRFLCVDGLPAGRAPNAILLLEDVTEREHRRRAERSFVENAAHQLRTPLAAIVSVIDVLEAGAKDDT